MAFTVFLKIYLTLVGVFLCFQLHLAALGSLRGEISELHARLQRAAQDRDTLEQALAKTQVCTQPILLVQSIRHCLFTDFILVLAL